MRSCRTTSVIAVESEPPRKTDLFCVLRKALGH